MKCNMQQRICDCHLRLGGSYCELKECNKERLQEVNNKTIKQEI